MRLTLFFLLVCISQVFAKTSYSQDTKLTLKLSQVSVAQVLKQIEDQSEFFFLYNNKIIDANRIVDVNVENRTIGDILAELFTSEQIDYLVLDRQIVLTPTKVLKDYTSKVVKAQQMMVKGKIIDTDGSPLAGASVLLKDTQTGTSTDIDGNYSISVEDANSVLVYSFVGYLSQEIIVSGRKVIDVVLEADVKELDDIVVVGYSSVKKSSLTGSISTVKGEQLVVAPSINFSSNLAGRLPGLVAVSSSGEPGRDDPALRIRGANTLGDNSPLIVIDGIAGRDMSRLDPSDIESITVLKDASAAIYGARAANGVILITTKRGSAGKPEITINLNTGWSMPTVIPDMADAATYSTMLNEIDYYNGQPLTYTPEEIQKYKDGSDPWLYPNTDWFDQVFKSSSKQYSADISVSGGAEKIKFFLAGGYKFQDMIYKNSVGNYSQGNFRSNIDADISDNIHLSIDLSGTQENRNFPPLSTSRIFSSLITGGAGSGGRPNQVDYYPENKPAGGFIQGMNPVVMGTDITGYDENNTYNLLSNIKLYVTIPWVKGLSVTGNASYDKNWYNQKYWLTPWYLYNWDGQTYDENNNPVVVPSLTGWAPDPQLTENTSNGQRVTLNGYINYEFSLADNHNFRILAGAEKITGESSYFMAYRRGYISTVIDQLFAGADPNKNNDGSASLDARLNYFGRVNYDYRNKYLLEFVWRYDGSYIFPEEGRFGFFPGVSAGWRISEENFWKNNIAFINYFKIRGSWGQTGNDRIDPYQYLASFGFGSTPYVYNQSLEVKTLYQLRTPNPDITWEVANQSNVGFDGQLFDGMFDFSADYFHNLRTNILWYRNASVPATAGLSLPMENIGEVLNQGVEIQLGFHKTTSNFKYNVSVNGSYARNEIKFWDETPGVPDYQKSTGSPMNAGLYYSAIGIFKDQAAVDAYPHWAGAEPGDIIFEDVNKDEVIDGLDMVRYDKTSLPRFTGGFNIDVTYKNIFASVFFQGATGAIRTFSIESGKIGNYLQEAADGRWTEDNPDADKPRTWNAASYYWSTLNNTYWLRNNDFLRLKDLQIGYNVPNSVTSKLHIIGFTIYFSGLNLITFSHEKSFDPETVGNNYPMNKVFNIGAKLTF